MAEKVSGLAGAVEDRDAAEETVRWIDRTYDDVETNRDFRVGSACSTGESPSRRATAASGAGRRANGHTGIQFRPGGF
jgi:hypothetical protein